MPIIDTDNLLTEEEREAYHQLLKLHGFEPHHFLIEVTEDQRPLDMNDMEYVVILNVKITHLQHDVSNTYISQFGSGTWISEFEDDLFKGGV